MDAPPLIVHIIYSLSTGGLENGLVNILNRFPAGRYRHAIVCITTADDFARRITADGVEVYQMHKRPGHDLGFYVRLRRLIRQLRPAIVHSRNLAALECQLCTLGIGGLKRIHGEHGREVGDLDGSNRKYLLFRRVMRLFVDHYIAVSRDLAAWLVQRVGVREERVTQVYNGVDHDRFTPETVIPLALLPQSWQRSGDIVVVGTVGRLTPVKDQQLILRAAAVLRQTQPELFARLRIMLVGDGPLRRQLQELIDTADLADHVWLAGDRDDVPQLLRLMDVFVLPSLGEGISNTILEAMASGLPVVATAVGGNLELVQDGETGALIAVGDERQLAQSLAQLLQDPGECARRGRAAQAFVSAKFDWNKTVLGYLAVYDGLSGPLQLAPTEAAN